MGADPLAQGGSLAIRAFFGLAVPEEHRVRLEPFLAQCSTLAPDFRWTPAANLHLTVRFVGQVEQSVVDAVADRVAEQRPAGFQLALGDIETFKRGRLARVVWLGAQGDIQPARALAALVESECRRAGLEPEERAFRAHVTLARARPRDGAALPPLPEAPFLDPWRADELILYRSHPGRGGSVYEVVRSIKLS